MRLIPVEKFICSGTGVQLIIIRLFTQLLRFFRTENCITQNIYRFNTFPF